MHFIYIDDSRDEQLCIFSALAIPVEQWHHNFQRIRDFRKALKTKWGIYVYKELHAWKFVSGRGRPSAKIITKSQRAKIFRQTVELVANFSEARLFNAVAPRKKDVTAFEWMLNRINKALKVWDSYGLLICDEGKEAIYTKLVRKLYVFNPIPSKFGYWAETQQSWKNVPIDRIVEDPFFKDSAKSYFIQLVDFCAYALLRRERPLPSKTKYNIHQVFRVLDPILVKEASSKDPEGIIRLG